MNGNHFSVVEAGPFNSLLNTSKDPAPGKYFLKNRLELTGMEVSLNQLPEGALSRSITPIARMRSYTFSLAAEVSFRWMDRLLM
jgi:hypothetical protein